MKKLLVTTLISLHSGFLFCLPVSNPADSSLLPCGIFLTPQCEGQWYDALHFRAGFYGDYVFNRHLKTESSQRHLDHSEIVTNAALVAVDFCDYVSVFSSLGTSNIALNGNASLFSADPEMTGIVTQLETSTDFSWSIGLKATLYRFDCTWFGIEGQYFSTHPDIFRITNASSFAVYPANLALDYREWQVGVGVTQSICDIAFPYVAVKYAHATCDLGHAQPYGIDNGPLTPIPFILPNLESAKRFGYAVGVTLVYFDALSLTLEGRFADEKAFHINGQVRF